MDKCVFLSENNTCSITGMVCRKSNLCEKFIKAYEFGRKKEKEKFNDVMRIDYSVQYGTTTEDRLLLFNKSCISESEANDLIRKGQFVIERDQRVLNMLPQQFDMIFGGNKNV